MSTAVDSRGIVYLIHFETPYKHARHYLGFSDGNLENRIAQHKANTGARLLQVVNDAGISWHVVRLWIGDRHTERRLKNWHNAPVLCPICSQKQVVRSK